MHNNPPRSNEAIDSETIKTKALWETLTFGALINAGKFVYDVSKQTYVAVKPDKPLLVVIEDSVTEEKHHRIVLYVANLGQHAVYLESFQIDKPKNVGVSSKILLEDKDFDVADLGKRSSRSDKLTDFRPVRLKENDKI